MYTNQAKLEAYLQRSLTANEALILDESIEYMSDYIRNYTNRNWLNYSPPWLQGTEYEIGEMVVVGVTTYICIDGHTAAAANRPVSGASWETYWEEFEQEDEARYYDGNNNRELFIDDFTSLTKVELLDSYGSVSSTISTLANIIQYPLNADVKSSIVLREYSKFRQGRANVKVTGVFNSGAVPSGIVMACTKLVAGYLVDTGDVSGDFKKESIEGYSYELMDSATSDTEVKSILSTLDKWKKFRL